MKQFISELKYKTGDELIIVWYDSMTIDGKMDWQNALTDRNSAFITSANNKNMSDSMFLNFWWNRAIDKANLLESSRDMA